MRRIPTPPLATQQVGRAPGEFALQVSFLGIRNRGNRNNGFYSWDYVDLGLNSAHATKNSGLRPLGLNSEIKTSIATFDEKKLILGIDTACRKCTSQLAVIQTGGPSELLICWISPCTALAPLRIHVHRGNRIGRESSFPRHREATSGALGLITFDGSMVR